MFHHRQQRRLKRKLKGFVRQVLVFLLTVFLFASQFLNILVSPVYAATSPWTQTDWSGGSGQTSWSDSTKFSSSSNVDTSTAGQVTLTATSNWYNTSWKYRKKITFDNSAQAENLTNFPVLVKLDSGTDIDYSKTQDSGQDIRFTDSDGTTLLKYEIEKWDETGSSYLWVKVPQIDASSTTDSIYMYYGNTSTSDGQDAENVWDGYYVMVHHLKETSGHHQDSTANNNDSSSETVTQQGANIGKLNGADELNGSGDYIVVSDSNSLDVTTYYTLEAWFKPDVTIDVDNDQSCLFYKSGAYGLWWQFEDDGLLRMGTWGGNIKSTRNSWAANTWYHVVAVHDGNTSYIYVNGSHDNSGTNTDTVTQEITDLWIGYHTWGGDIYFDGVLDELRVSNTARSANWVAAQYKSMNDIFNIYGSEEERYASPGTLTSSILDTEQQSDWGTLTYNTDGVATTTVKVRTSNNSDMSGATDFGSCTAISSGSDISSDGCVTDTHRYVQYQITLTSVSADTPTFQDISIAFTASDSDPPSISLTALSPDPTTNTTPSISGTATESVGTVSNVQFQMESTSGSWTACTADDGTFDEASEAFTCAVSTALSDGSHTIYVRARDSNSNTTTNANAATDTFTIDTTAPASLDLDSPGGNSYTNSERPTFKWKAASTPDVTSGLSKYKLELDNGDSGDFTIDDIPTSRTTDYETNKYLIHYENFSDSDSTNNYISVYTKSSSDWSSSENDGKLKEGKRNWKVTAVDNAGNTREESRALFVDRSGPSAEVTQINDTSFADNLATTNKTSTIYGKITDALEGDKTDNKVASGPKEAELRIEKKNYLGLYNLHTLSTVNLTESYWSNTGEKITDNYKNSSNKYSTFEYTPSLNLSLGSYKITLTGKDKAGNVGGSKSFNLTITALEEVVEEELPEVTPEEKEEIEEELEIVRPTVSKEPSFVEKLASRLATTAIKTHWKIIEGARVIGRVGLQATQQLASLSQETAKQIAFAWNSYSQFVVETNQKTMAFVSEKAGQIISSAKTFASNTASAVGQSLAFIGEQIGKKASFVGEKAKDAVLMLAKSYDALAQKAPGVVGNVMLALENKAAKVAIGVTKTKDKVASAVTKTSEALSEATTTVGRIEKQIAGIVGSTTKSITQGVGEKLNKTAKKVAQATRNATAGINSTISNTTTTIGRNAEKFAKNTKIWIAVTSEIYFDKEATKITEVKVLEVGETYAVIFWRTNHHTKNNKVNYGEDLSYGNHLFAPDMQKEHVIKITNLKPNIKYVFEVMSQNKNYVFDARHEFTTLPEKIGGEKE